MYREFQKNKICAKTRKKILVMRRIARTLIVGLHFAVGLIELVYYVTDHVIDHVTIRFLTKFSKLIENW